MAFFLISSVVLGLLDQLQIFLQFYLIELAAELESVLRDTVDWGKKWLVGFNAGKTQLASFDQSNNTDVLMDVLNGCLLHYLYC